MAHVSTVLSQLLQIVPRHEFESLARTHHVGQKLRKVSRWDQFVALVVGQLGGKQSLRDIEANLAVQQHKLYHLGSRGIRRSSLARLNEQQSPELYRALFERLVQLCQPGAPGHPFRFNSKLYSLDASLIELSLSLMPWANYNGTKAAVKLHVGLDHDGLIPEFVALTDAKDHDVNQGRRFAFPKGSIVVCDRGYVDYAWFKSLSKKDIFFVTRQKKNARYQRIRSREVIDGSGVKADEEIELTGVRTKEIGPLRLRRVVYIDQQTGNEYVFLTNHFRLSASTIARIYKHRWKIELFFKEIKQNLRIHSFLGTSKNAVMSQIWAALCVYLLLAYLKFSAKLGWSIHRMIRVLTVNLFERRGLIDLLSTNDRPPDKPPPQLSLRWS